MEQKQLKRSICSFLLNIKMKNTAIGLCYWITAINYYISLIKENSYQVVRMNQIYERVAQEHHTTKHNAEKAMRYAKEKSDYQNRLKVEHELKNFEFLILCSSKFLNNVSQEAV